MAPPFSLSLSLTPIALKELATLVLGSIGFIAAMLVIRLPTATLRKG